MDMTSIPVISNQKDGVMKYPSNLDQAYIKQHNIQRVLSVLEHFQPLSRTDLAHITAMSPTSVTRIVGALLSLGLVDETSVSSAGGRGRRAVNLKTRPDGIYTLGFHIDTRMLRMCLLNFDNHACFTSSAALAQTSPEELARCARELSEHIPPSLLPDPSKLRAVGVSVSGRVEPSKGVVVRSEALNWTDVRLSRVFERAFDLPVRIENDVKSCLTWERVHRALADEQDVAYLYIGRAGIGFANTSNGAIVRGRSSSAGEIECLQLSPGNGLDLHLMEKHLVARARNASPEVDSLKDILVAYRMKLSWAQILMNDFSDTLGMLLRTIRALLDPHLIILGGDMPEALSQLPELLSRESFTLGEHFEDSCALGAAVVAMREAVHTLIGSTLGD